MHALHKFPILACLTFSFAVQASDAEWYVLNREDGCVEIKKEFNRENAEYNTRTPGEMFQAIRKGSAADVQIRPFIEHVNAELSAAGKKMSPEQSAFYKAFSSTNAFVITSRSRSIEIALFSASLCRTIGGFSK